MKWIRNSHGGWRSEDDQFYIQQSHKKFYRLFAKGADGDWKMVSPPLKDAAEGKQLAASLVAA